MASGIFYPAVSGDDGRIQQTYPLNSDTDMITIGDIGGYNYLAFVRFANVAIPQGATITAAFIRVTAYADRSDVVVRTNIYFNDIDDAVAPIDMTEYDALVETAAFTVWDGIEAWSDGTTYDTPSLVDELQEVVGRGGFASGNAVMAMINDDGSDTSAGRYFSAIDYLSGAEKAELHVTWTTPEAVFTFTDPVPEHLSTVYGTNRQLQLTTTISGEEESYTYDAEFYDGFGVQVGTTVLGVNSGSPAASNAYLSTPSGIDYSWYVVATSSGSEDTSATYTFSNRFLYSGYVTENTTPVNRQIYLHNRDTGELVGETTSSGVDGSFYMETTYNGICYAVCLDNEEGLDYNDLIYGNIFPATVSG